MPWNDTARIEHRRDAVRYPSDLRDRAWALIAPLLPPAKRGGRPRTTDLRSVVDAIVYVASSGCQWRMLPKDFPPVSTVQGYFYAWRDSGLWQGINHLLVMSTRELEGREASPTAGVIYSQSVKTTESGGVCGYDAGKKIKGRKRHIMTDTLDRHARLAAVCRHPFGRRAGPGRCARRLPGDPVSVPLAAPRVRRRRLCGRQTEDPPSGATATGPSRSSNDPTPQAGLRFCPVAGSSSAPSHGSADAVASRRIGRNRWKARLPGH